MNHKLKKTEINENNNTKLTVSPNPANNFINLTFYNSLSKICKIQIFSAVGKNFICDYKNDDNTIKFYHNLQGSI